MNRELEDRRMRIAANSSANFNLATFCYKEFEKFALCKSISQMDVIFIVYYSEPIKSGHGKINFS